MLKVRSFVRLLRRVLTDALLYKDFDGSVLYVRAVLVEILIENSRRLKQWRSLESSVGLSRSLARLVVAEREGAVSQCPAIRDTADRTRVRCVIPSHVCGRF
jgi:hypothetical protein